MPRTSRKDRKLQRQRATNATERGLPTPELELRVGTRVASSSTSSASPVTSDIESSTRPKAGWFAAWSLPMKLLGAVALATLALLGLSLYRTLAGGGSVSPEAAPAPTGSVGSAVAPAETATQTAPKSP